MEKRLYRSRRERMVGGVCGGLADYFGADVTIVRLAVVALALVTSGAVLLAYVLLWVLVPEEPVEGRSAMSDTTPVPVPEPAPLPAGQPDDAAAESTAPTYSAPTYTPPVEPAAPPAQPAPYAPPPYAPQSVTGDQASHEARSGGIIGGIVLIVLGGIFLVSQFTGINFSQLWPLILIAIGIGIIVRRR